MAKSKGSQPKISKAPPMPAAGPGPATPDLTGGMGGMGGMPTAPTDMGPPNAAMPMGAPQFSPGDLAAPPKKHRAHTGKSKPNKTNT